MKKYIVIIAVILVLGQYSAVVKGASWSNEAVGYLVQKEYISYNDVLLNHLEENINRGEAVRLLACLFKDDPAPQLRQSEYFTDIAPQSILFSQTAYAYERGYITGFEDKTFRSDDAITREDFFTMSGRAAGLSAETGTLPFTDTEELYSYSRPFVLSLYQNEIIAGYPDNTLRPKSPVLVEEAMSIVYHLIKKQETEQASTSSVSVLLPMRPGRVNSSATNRPATKPSETPSTPDETSPVITYELSETKQTNNPVSVQLQITDQSSLAKCIWLYPNNIYMERFGDEQAILTYEQAVREEVEQHSVHNGSFEVKQNGYYLVYAEDAEGNFAVDLIYIDNIVSPQITVEVVKEKNGGSVVAAVHTVSTNPNAHLRDAAFCITPWPLSAGGVTFENTGTIANTILNRKYSIPLDINEEMTIKIPFNSVDLNTNACYDIVVIDDWGNSDLVCVKTEDISVPIELWSEESTEVPGAVDLVWNYQQDGISNTWYDAKYLSDRKFMHSIAYVGRLGDHHIYPLSDAQLPEVFEEQENFQTLELTETAYPIKTNGLYIFRLMNRRAREPEKNTYYQQLEVNTIPRPKGVAISEIQDRQRLITVSEVPGGNPYAEIETTVLIPIELCQGLDYSDSEYGPLFNAQIAEKLEQGQEFEGQIAVPADDVTEYAVILLDSWGNASFARVE